MSFYTHDNTVDSPINNFAALNPLNKSNSVQLSEGNLDVTVTTNSYHAVLSTIAVSSGKWYFEGLLTGMPAAPDFGFCIPEVAAADIVSFSYNIRPKLYGIATNGSGNAIRYYSNTGASAPEINETPNSGGWSAGTIVSVYADFDLGKMRFAKNGVWYDLELSFPPNITLTPRTSGYQGYGSAINFGQDHSFGGVKTGGGAYTDANGIGQFYYEPPEGALALCTANLPEGPIKISEDDVPSDYFKAVTWAGDNQSSRDITDVNFSPDFIWVKQRNQAYSSGHQIYDSVRGLGSEKEINSSSTNAEGAGNIESYGYLSELLSKGFRVVDGTVGRTYVNHTGNNYVAWCWKAAGAPLDNETRIIDTDGTLITKSTADLKNETGASITPSKVSANRKCGFSIVKYAGNGSSGATVPHGLSQHPDFTIIKRTSSGTPSNWICNHTSLSQMNATTNNIILSGGESIYLNLPNQKSNYVFDVQVNGTSNDYICYAWHSVAGYSKFGSYVGNESVDGPYVECGFRPAWVMWKRTDRTSNWWITDNKRSPYNPTNAVLSPNQSAKEASSGTGQIVDFTSNGFKIRNYGTEHNASASTYVFAAFAEVPFNAPATAR